MIIDLQNKICNKCGEVKLISEFSNDKTKKDGHRTICKNCTRSYHAVNFEEIKVRKAKYRETNYEKIRLKESKYDETRSERKKQYYRANFEKIKVLHTKYQKANLDKHRAYAAKRRAIKLLAIPSWLTKEDYQTMEAIYTEAKRLETVTGVKHHVDHIDPLQGKFICGFHCPANLQILTESENLTKGNTFKSYSQDDNGITLLI